MQFHNFRREIIRVSRPPSLLPAGGQHPLGSIQYAIHKHCYLNVSGVMDSPGQAGLNK
jgi:hypothetical protein